MTGQTFVPCQGVLVECFRHQGQGSLHDASAIGDMETCLMEQKVSIGVTCALLCILLSISMAASMILVDPQQKTPELAAGGTSFQAA